MSWFYCSPECRTVLCLILHAFLLYIHLSVQAGTDSPDNKLSQNVFLVSIGWDDATWYGI